MSKISNYLSATRRGVRSGSSIRPQRCLANDGALARPLGRTFPAPSGPSLTVGLLPRFWQFNRLAVVMKSSELTSHSQTFQPRTESELQYTKHARFGIMFCEARTICFPTSGIEAIPSPRSLEYRLLAGRSLSIKDVVVKVLKARLKAVRQTEP